MADLQILEEEQIIFTDSEFGALWPINIVLD